MLQLPDPRDGIALRQVSYIGSQNPWLMSSSAKDVIISQIKYLQLISCLRLFLGKPKPSGSNLSGKKMSDLVCDLEVDR